MIRLKCPTCARPLGFDEAYIGLPGLCPGCGATFTVPAPAVLLDDAAPGTGPRPPDALPPLATVTGQSSARDAGPLLPEGPLGLVPEAPPDLAPAERAWDDGDPWLRTEARLRPVTPEAPRPLTPEGPTPSADRRRREVAEGDLLPLVDDAPLPLGNAPEEGQEANDWQFLSLDDPGAAPAAKAPAAAPPPLPLLEIPEQPDSALPLLEPPSLPAPVPPPRPAPAAMPPPLPTPQLVPHDAIQVPVTVVPVDAGPPRAEPRTASLRAILLDEPPPRKKKRKPDGPVSLIPGLDDFYLGMIALGVIWLVMVVIVLLAPKVFWLPVVFGSVVYFCAGFWFRQSMQDVDPIWSFLVFIPLLSVVFILIDRSPRSVRPFAATILGMVITLTGWAAKPANYWPVDEDRPDPPAFFQGQP